MDFCHPANWFYKRVSSKAARSFPRFNTPLLFPGEIAKTHPLMPFQTPEAFKTPAFEFSFVVILI